MVAYLPLQRQLSETVTQKGRGFLPFPCVGCCVFSLQWAAFSFMWPTRHVKQITLSFEEKEINLQLFHQRKEINQIFFPALRIWKVPITIIFIPGLWMDPFSDLISSFVIVLAMLASMTLSVQFKIHIFNFLHPYLFLIKKNYSIFFVFLPNKRLNNFFFLAVFPFWQYTVPYF